MSNTIELAVKPRLVLKIDGKEYTIEYPISAVIAAEKTLGHSLKSLSDWFELKWDEVAGLLHAGLAKFHPDVALEEIKTLCDDMGVEGVLLLKHALVSLNFPKAMGRIEERLKSGDTSPNAPSGDAS